MRRVLGLFARAPVAGSAKTRLSPPLTPQQCASLYEAMLFDIVDQHARSEEFDLSLWCTPAGACSWFEARLPARCRVLPQQGEDLGARLAAAVRFHAAEGYERIVLRGTDSPSLPLASVAGAFEALDRADLVLCPDLDGGYSLIGLRRPCDSLFRIALGTETVLVQTRKQADRIGLRTQLLPPHQDVDVISDLERIRDALSSEHTPRTLAWLEDWTDS